MSIQQTNKGHAKKVAQSLAQAGTTSSNPLVGIWSWINGLAHSTAGIIAGPITNLFKVIEARLDGLSEGLSDALQAYVRLRTWVEFYVLDPLADYTYKEFTRVNARITRVQLRLVEVIFAVARSLMAYTRQLVHAEAQARQRAIARAEALARREVKALHTTIEQEAVSAYRVFNPQRVSVATRLLDYAAARVPLVSVIAGRLVTAALDLASIDNPVARVVAGFLLKRLIGHLGIDKAVGVLVSDILTPMLGTPKPTGLHDVIKDMSARLLAAEQQWAQFMTDGGSQVEQAGTDWRNITSVITDAALVAFTVQAVADPVGWASEISNTVGTAANDLAIKAATMFGG